jgi:hypothetical protein
MTTMDDGQFWKRMDAGMPGMIGAGLGIWSGNQLAKGNAELLNRAQSPLYKQSMAASGQALANAGNMDPKAAAQERFNAQQQLLAGQDTADENALFRRLNAMGMLGAASHESASLNPAAGGGPINPQMAAFYAARNQRNAQSAYDSLREGEGMIDNQLRRSGMLASQAGGLQNSGLAAQRTQVNPGAKNASLAKAGYNMLKDTGLLKDAGGMLRSGASWLGDLFNSGSSNAFDMGALAGDDYRWDWS